MRVLVYSAHPYEEATLKSFSAGKHELVFAQQKLGLESVALARGFQAVSLFTSDNASAPVLRLLNQAGVQYMALRSAGFDHVDLGEASRQGIAVANVPDYSPYSIAEHAVAMLMAVNRKIIQGWLLQQVQDYRLDALKGFDVHGKTVGIIGTGKTGMAFASIMKGFGARLLASDPVVNSEAEALGITYCSLSEVLSESDIVSVHCPLNEATRYMLAAEQFRQMKKGSILINTARGGIVKTTDLVAAIEDGTLRAVCLDVYEHEKGLFFEDHRRDVLKDPLFARLRNFTNVLITGHQAFLTEEAITGIARVTIANLDAWQQSKRSPNELT